MFLSDSTLQHEGRLFIRGCQHLLSALSFPGCHRLSEDERRSIELYANELLSAMGIGVKR